MFERLTDGLSRAFERVRGKDPDAAREAFLAAVRDRLIEADAHPGVVDELVERLTNRLERSDAGDSDLSPSQRFLQELQAEVARILGEKPEPLRFKSSGTSALMVVGLQGTGKTTSVGKLARRLKEEGRSVMLVPLDVQRPAAIDQLKVLGADLDLPVWNTPNKGKPVKEARAALKTADKDGIDVVLFDTAGRLAIDKELMKEIATLRDKLRPQEILYVMDAMAGQTAVQTAESFAAAVKPTGIVLTKVDADPRGGAVLSVRARTGIPVKLMGTGEKAADMEVFDPDRIARRVLDMGDLEGLAEKFDQSIDVDEAEKLSEKFLSAKFNLEDFAKQLELMGNLGSLESILKMMPGGKGLAKQAKDLSLAEGEMTKTLAVIRSMTPKERRNPRLIGNSNKRRIAKGSGTSTGDVSRVLKRYQTMRKLMKKFSKSPMGAMKNLLGGGGFPGGGGMPGGGMPGGGLPPGMLGR